MYTQIYYNVSAWFQFYIFTLKWCHSETLDDFYQRGFHMIQTFVQLTFRFKVLDWDGKTLHFLNCGSVFVWLCHPDRWRFCDLCSKVVLLQVSVVGLCHRLSELPLVEAKPCIPGLWHYNFLTTLSVNGYYVWQSWCGWHRITLGPLRRRL